MSNVIRTGGHRLQWLASARLFWALVAVNLLVTAAVAFVTFRSDTPDDHYTWLGLAEGLRHGRYSFWYFLPTYVPDTFRNPGYPLFLFALKTIGASEGKILLAQLGLYLASIALMLQIAARCESGPQSWRVRNLFLLLLLPNIQLAWLAAYIYPEVLTAFLITVYAFIALTWPRGTWKRVVVLALLAGMIFQVRPTFIFFPLFQLALDFRATRPRAAFSWAQAGAFLVIFCATMLPYTLWNHRHHGVWKPTSLEGGAGVMQIGFWALRMPGYQEHRYWGNTMGDEIVSFADPADVPAHIAAFNHEWDVIDAQCEPLITARDRRLLALVRDSAALRTPEYGGIYPSYNSAYALRREQMLMQANVADILREPGYYFKTRLYTLVRLWVTGIQVNAWRAAATPVAKIKVLYPTLVSGITFLLAVVSVGWGLSRRALTARSTWWLALALVVYFGLIHLPFAIQARYTVPVRPWLLLLIALAGAAWLSRRSGLAATGEEEPMR